MPAEEVRTMTLLTEQEAGRIRVSAMRNLEASDRVKKLISEFRSKDGARRQRARLSLVAMGKIVIPFINQYLEDKDDHVRWEIAKTLEELRNPAAAPAMVKLLADDVPGVRWLAAEGLINVREHGLVPLLKGLQVSFHSTFFRESAHHVLRELDRERLLDENGQKILKTLEGPAPAVSVPFAAREALLSLQRSR